MVETAAAITTLPPKRRIVWFWLSNPNSFGQKEKQKWKRYSDFENEFIEEAYQHNKKQVELNDYIINFGSNIQFKKDDMNSQIPIKREEIDADHYVRTERFSFPERANKSFVPNSGGLSPFIEQWREKNLAIVYDFDFLAIAELAAQGKFSNLYLTS